MDTRGDKPLESELATEPMPGSLHCIVYGMLSALTAARG